MMLDANETEEYLMRELRHAARRLVRRPMLTVVVTLTMALAIAATTTVFHVVHDVLLRPLPVAGEDRVVKLWKYDPARDFDHFPILFDEFRRWRDHGGGFRELAAMVSEGTWSLPMERAAGAEPTLVRVAPVSADFFAVVGASPVLGRGFQRADETPAGHRAVVLSHDAWVRRFDGAADALGRLLTVDGQPQQVVGVMPPGFDYPAGTEFWQCLPTDTRAELEAIGRLNPGVDRDRVRAEIQTLSRRFADEQAPWLADKVVVAVSLRESLVGEVRRPLLVLFAAAGLVLAVACANVAHLLLVEALARRRQFAIRSALGAPRHRLLLQLLTESGLLAALGGVAGVGLATVALEALERLRPAALSPFGAMRLDGPVLGFSLLVTGVAALAFGLAPALAGTRSAALGAGSFGARSPGHHRSALPRVLAVAEISLAMVLLIAAGLLLRSFREHLRLDRGFRSDHLVAVELKVPSSERGRDRMLALYDGLLPRLASLPGVASASPTLNRPFATTDGFDAQPTIAGKTPEETASLPWVHLEAVSPSYAETLELELESGRFFDSRDRAEGQPVAVVNRALAAAYWPGEEAVGKRLMLFEADGWRTVVGVVSDLRLRDPTAVRLGLYLPMAQSPWMPRHLTVRTSGDPAVAVAALRRELRRWLPGAAIGITPVETLLSAEIAAPRFNALLVTAFASLALILAAVGVYGVMAALVGQRRSEIGVRMALGADGRWILRLFLGDGLKLALGGVLLGSGAALVAARWMESLLFRTRTADPATFAGLALLLTAVAMLAVLIPARRAARVDPLTVLGEN